MSQVDLFYVLIWWFVFFLIGGSFLPLSSRIFSNFIDKGYIFSKILGVLFISYSMFVLSSLHLLKFTSLNIIGVWTILVIASLLVIRRNILGFGKNIKIFVLEEFIFFSSLLLWSWVRSFQPAIHDLEKFMDFGFVSSILRTDYFPPKDMWLTPFSINYYYFGHLFTAVLTKISALPSFITFNLMIATIFAFTFSTSFSIGINLIHFIRNYSLKKTFILGLLFGYIVTLAGNLQTIYAFFSQYKPENPMPFWKLTFSFFTFPNAYWYPNATRFIEKTIHEFPSYSFVVADLHGHVLDIPVVACIIALLLSLFIGKKISSLKVVLIAFLLSISYMTNAWDGLIYLGLTGLVIFIFIFLQQKGKLNKKIIDSLFKSIKYALILFLGFFIFSFVFNRNFSPFASGIGLNCSPDFLINIKKMGPFIFEKGQCQHSPLWQLLILYGFFLYSFLSFMIFLRRKKLIITDYFVLIISFFSLILIIIPEFFYLKDIYTGYFRANTMFKLSYQAFIMFSLSSVYILIRIISSARNGLKTKLSKFSFVFFCLGFLVLLFLVSIYPYFAVPSGYGNLNKYQGLNGITYLKQIKTSDYQAILWINQNIKGQPVILEAQGDSYTDFARISANTGLPTVLGWTVHEWLWRGSYDVPSARFDDIRNLYQTDNTDLAKKIIKKYNISLIYVGLMEKDKYAVSEDKFLKLGKLIYATADVSIYKIN